MSYSNPEEAVLLLSHLAKVLEQYDASLHTPPGPRRGNHQAANSDDQLRDSGSSEPILSESRRGGKEARVEGEPLRIGIIAPYKQQTEFIRNYILENELFKDSQHHFSVRTVDGFQGQERDIICISMTRSNDNGEIGFLADTRRMNVALTRAKRKLLVFGDSATLANHGFYKSFLDYVEEIGGYRSMWEFV